MSQADFPRWKAAISQLLFDSMRINFPNYEIDVSYCNAKCAEIDTYLKDNKAIIYLAVSEGALLGWIWLHEIRRVKTKRLHVAEIAIVSSVRGKGVGTRLLQVAESYAKDHGYAEMDLLVTESNSKAIQFYEKANYVSERRLMKKTLEPNLSASQMR